ncbi:MAG: type II toxin-antitoxin system CcdA family antitoxin [Pseudomonadota bacterium]
MTQVRKPTNLSLDSAIVAEAKELGISLSQAAESGIAAAVARAKTEHWKRENAEAIQATNKYVEQNGLPLEKHRLF